MKSQNEFLENPLEELLPESLRELPTEYHEEYLKKVWKNS